ncbi:hypothetical protein BDF20DRAFT_686355 [Mycotypha africana]|uniref:uncharacterized protein n=1 Tax=Mycotypha africana TaxID=64632 RepID=UPI002301AEDC|nr:uncharacterized protein BDF20DRAFT_686355 [Mycotypha africana]KAI8971565.1 hypothetical protein BDF20DRAFT_686355 [Mycotypha africana]
MVDGTPTSPVPNSNHMITTEETRLLGTSTTSYSTRQKITTHKETIITIGNSVKESINSFRFTGANIATAQHFQSIISAGQPTVPSNELVEKVQDILVFGEIKKQQERALAQNAANKQGKQRENGDADVPSTERRKSSDSSSSSSSSDTDCDEGSTHHMLKKKLNEFSIDKVVSDSGKKLRKRDLAVDALKFATDKWKEKHGWQKHNNGLNSPHSSGSSASLITNNNIASTATTIVTDIGQKVSGGNVTTVVKTQKKRLEEAYSSSAEDVFGVAKNASVCAVMALLHERRQSSGHSADTDISLQSLALATLNLGLKAQETSASHVVLYEMLTGRWINGKSALELAADNNCQLILNDARVQLVIQDMYKNGSDWRNNPKHPSHIWLNHNESPLEAPSKNFVWFVLWRTFTDYLARWPNARYQTMIELVSALIYLGFHLASVSNLDYTSDTPHVYEYIYYVLVLSDGLYELYKLFTRPCVYLKKASYYTAFITATLLVASFIVRIYALTAVKQIDYEIYLLRTSYNLLILATPLMFFRVFISSSNSCWSTKRTATVLHRCFVNSLWVLSLGALVLVSFWVALGALQRADIKPLAMLRLLILGALHTPEIGNTLYYQPQAAGLLLAVYLFLTVVVLGSLLTASFLGTFIEISKELDTIKRDWVIERCLKTSPALSTFIPTVVVDLFFGVLAWFARVALKSQKIELCIQKIHQIFWYIIFSPVILLVGLLELITSVIFKWNAVKSMFQKGTIRI